MGNGVEPNTSVSGMSTIAVEVEEVGRCAVRLIAHDEAVFVRPALPFREIALMHPVQGLAEVALDAAQGVCIHVPCRPINSAA